MKTIEENKNEEEQYSNDDFISEDEYNDESDKTSYFDEDDEMYDDTLYFDEEEYGEEVYGDDVGEPMKDPNNDLSDDHEVEFYLMSMEEAFEEDMESGHAFIITDRSGLAKNNTERTENGIYSPKYGSIWQDENAFKELYRCDCGKLEGKAYLGLTCAYCNSEVKFRDKDISMTGYFVLDNYKVIHPTIYSQLGMLIGKKKLNNMLTADWKSDADGNPKKPVIDNSRNIDKYANIGMIEFMHRFDEILDFFYQKKKEKKPIYDFIRENRAKVFTSCLPCISLILRPIILGDEDFQYTKINTKYSILSSKIYSLNHKYRDIDNINEKLVNKRLYEVQTTYALIDKELTNSLNKKAGLIRANIHGVRCDHGTRAVIKPLNRGKINEVEFPYLGMLYMYKPEIINLLCKLDTLTINEAYMIWLKGTVKFNKKIFGIMEYIVKTYKPKILLNRNPTINFGSIMRMTIRKVKKDYNDLTISIPINVCGAFNADFDGDALNSLSLKDSELVAGYAIYDPRLNMMISKNDGLFDNSFNLIKDQIICLHQFCVIGGQTRRLKISRTRLKKEKNNMIKDINKNKSEARKKRKVKIKRIKVA